MKKHFLSRIGLSLIEVIIYIAIVSTVLFAASNFLLEVMKGQSTTHATQELQSNARFALHTISNVIRGADLIDFAQSTLDVHPGQLVVQTSSSNTNPTVIRVDSVTNGLEIIYATNDPQALTSNEIEVQNFVVSQKGGSVDSPNISIDLTVAYKNPNNIPEFDKTYTLNSSFSNRK